LITFAPALTAKFIRDLGEVFLPGFIFDLERREGKGWQGINFKKSRKKFWWNKKGFYLCRPVRKEGDREREQGESWRGK